MTVRKRRIWHFIHLGGAVLMVLGLTFFAGRLPLLVPPSVCWAQDASAPAPLAPVDDTHQIKRNARGEPLVSNIFLETDLRQALSDVAVQTGEMIIADNTVQGTVSVELKDVPLERALDIMLRPVGMAYARVDGYYLVGAPDPSNPNWYLFCQTEVVQLQHASPQSIIRLLSAPYGIYLSAEGVTPQYDTRTTGSTSRMSTITSTRLSRTPQSGVATSGFTMPTTSPTDERETTNQIVITAPSWMVPRIRADIAALDRPRTQVMLEASVVEVSDDALRSVGIDWATRWISFQSVTDGPNLVYSEVANNEMVALRALIENRKARVRANPRVSTVDGQTAEIEVGKENYFAISSGSVVYPYTTLERITSGILFRITPRVIAEENAVLARLEPEVRDVTGRGANGLPEITYRKASTNLRVPDGQSIVIGGLISESSEDINRRVPVLGDIPLLGNLFRRTDTTRSRIEVVIVITPHIMRDGVADISDVPGARPGMVMHRTNKLQLDMNKDRKGFDQ